MIINDKGNAGCDVMVLKINMNTFCNRKANIFIGD